MGQGKEVSGKAQPDMRGLLLGVGQWAAPPCLPGAHFPEPWGHLFINTAVVLGPVLSSPILAKAIIS